MAARRFGDIESLVRNGPLVMYQKREVGRNRQAGALAEPKCWYPVTTREAKPRCLGAAQPTLPTGSLANRVNADHNPTAQLWSPNRIGVRNVHFLRLSSSVFAAYVLRKVGGIEKLRRFTPIYNSCSDYFDQTNRLESRDRI